MGNELADEIYPTVIEALRLTRVMRGSRANLQRCRTGQLGKRLLAAPVSHGMPRRSPRPLRASIAALAAPSDP